MVAVADADELRRRQAEETLGCRSYADPADLIADDGVRPARRLHLQPPALRARHRRPAGRAQRPLREAVRPDRGRLRPHARRRRGAGRLVVPFQNRRYEPLFRKVLEVVRSGRPRPDPAGAHRLAELRPALGLADQAGLRRRRPGQQRPPPARPRRPLHRRGRDGDLLRPAQRALQRRRRGPRQDRRSRPRTARPSTWSSPPAPPTPSTAGRSWAPPAGSAARAASCTGAGWIGRPCRSVRSTPAPRRTAATTARPWTGTRRPGRPTPGGTWTTAPSTTTSTPPCARASPWRSPRRASAAR